MMKKWMISIAIVLLLMCLNTMDVKAETVGLESFGVDVIVEPNTFTYTVKWWRQELATGNEYYIIIPSSAENKNLQANFVSDSDVYIDDEKIENGQVLSNFEYGYHKILCDEKVYSLFVIYGSDIPTIHIITESGSMENVYQDINYKEPGYVVIIDDDEIVYEGDLEYIKGRGNYTWTREKKPFNIKLRDKTDLFGMGASRKWCLLANYLDDTLLKNKLGYDLANSVGLDFSPESVIVDLYINNEYIGNYTLSERIEVGENRVDITDLEELNELANQGTELETLESGNNGINDLQYGSAKWVELPNIPEVTSGGYLLEFEVISRYGDETSGFISEYGQPIVIKNPEYASKEQVEYISNYYQEFENALLSGDGYNEYGKHYSEYIDVESVAKMYVFQEYVKNLDAGLTSCFFYKDVGGKLAAAPVWDLDSAFGRSTERNGVKMEDPNSLWVTGSLLYEDNFDKYTIFSLLCRYNDFRMEAQKQWEEHFVPNIDTLLNNLNNLYEETQISLFTDKFKWNTVRGLTYSDAYNQMECSIETLRHFIIQRSEYMSEIFSDEKCTIEYNSNGGSGQMVDLTYYDQGCKVHLQENVYTNDGRKFLGWNTKASGWGEFYEDGSEIILEDVITLYAQWEKNGFQEMLANLWQGILGN